MNNSFAGPKKQTNKRFQFNDIFLSRETVKICAHLPSVTSVVRGFSFLIYLHRCQTSLLYCPPAGQRRRKNNNRPTKPQKPCVWWRHFVSRKTNSRWIYYASFLLAAFEHPSCALPFPLCYMATLTHTHPPTQFHRVHRVSFLFEE